MLGCAVNGIGEASHADFGITGAKNEGLIFAHGEPLRKVPQDDLVEALFAEIDKSIDRGAVLVDEPRPPRAPSGSRRSRRRTPASSPPSGSLRWRPPPRARTRSGPATPLPMAGAAKAKRITLDEDASPTAGRRFTRA